MRKVVVVAPANPWGANSGVRWMLRLFTLGLSDVAFILGTIIRSAVVYKRRGFRAGWRWANPRAGGYGQPAHASASATVHVEMPHPIEARVSTPTAPSPGWYPDGGRYPDGAVSYRWWDGRAWTAHVGQRQITTTARP